MKTVKVWRPKREEKGIIKDFLTYRKAKSLMKKIKNELSSSLWDITIYEDEYNRKLKIEYKYGSPKTEDLVKVIELLMDCNTKIWFHGYLKHNNEDAPFFIYLKN